jgi:hypothetical protein
MKHFILLLVIIQFVAGNSGFSKSDNIFENIIERNQLPADTLDSSVKLNNNKGETLIEIMEESGGASILLPPLSSIINSNNKLYNINNVLHWNDSPIQSPNLNDGWTITNENVVLSDSNRKVGIGTSKPQYKMHLDNGELFIKGYSNWFQGIIMRNEIGRSVLRLEGTRSDNNLNSTELSLLDLTNGSSWRLLNANNNTFSILNHSASSGFSVAFQIEFGAPSNSMTINSNGNIGIGVWAGDHKLAVAGSIISEEVVVKLQSNWPDFVFTDDYSLKNLYELEDYIQKHNHLVDIPSKDEISKNGIDLAEIQIKLLQKIEELTLYTIQQHKDIESLKEQIQLLHKNCGRIK